MLYLSDVRPGDIVRRKPDGDPKPVLKVDGNFIRHWTGGFTHYKFAELKTPMGWRSLKLDFHEWLRRYYDANVL